MPQVARLVFVAGAVSAVLFWIGGSIFVRVISRRGLDSVADVSGREVWEIFDDGRFYFPSIGMAAALAIMFAAAPLALPDDPRLGFLSAAIMAPLFGSGVVLLVVYVRDRRPRVVIDDTGIRIREFGYLPLRWRDIRELTFDNTPYGPAIMINEQAKIGVRLFERKKYLRQLSLWRRFLAATNWLFGKGHFTIWLYNIRYDPIELLDALERRWREAVDKELGGG